MCQRDLRARVPSEQSVLQPPPSKELTLQEKQAIEELTKTLAVEAAEVSKSPSEPEVLPVACDCCCFFQPKGIQGIKVIDANCFFYALDV
jgi:hypothetical protein